MRKIAGHFLPDVPAMVRCDDTQVSLAVNKLSAQLIVHVSRFFNFGNDLRHLWAVEMDRVVFLCATEKLVHFVGKWLLTGKIWRVINHFVKADD
jgi:hypothetical protein